MKRPKCKSRCLRISRSVNTGASADHPILLVWSQC